MEEFLAGATEIGDGRGRPSRLIDDALGDRRRLWERRTRAPRHQAGERHGPERARSGSSTSSFAQVRPSPWRQAVDLANMMLVLALGSSPELVYERARLRFSEDEIAEAFAASRGVTLPSQLRRDVRRTAASCSSGSASSPRTTAGRDPAVVAASGRSDRRGCCSSPSAVVSIFVSNLQDIGLR